MSLHTTGYLYFNTRSLPLDAMLEDAAREFHTQHGLDQPVNFAVVNPSLLPGGKTRKGGIDVSAMNTILPGQCWIGHAPRRSPQVMIPEPVDSSGVAALAVPVPGLKEKAPQPGLLVPGHEIHAPGCALPIGRNLAALVAAEQGPAPRLALPAPSAWSAVQRTRERQDLTNLLHNMKATREEFLAAMDLHRAGAHATLTRLVRHVPARGTSFPYDNSRSEGYRKAIRYLEGVLEERKRRDQRQRRVADLVARFQLEYEQLHPPMQDYIIPSTGQVVKRPPVIALPGAIREVAAARTARRHIRLHEGVTELLDSTWAVRTTVTLRRAALDGLWCGATGNAHSIPPGELYIDHVIGGQRDCFCLKHGPFEIVVVNLPDAPAPIPAPPPTEQIPLQPDLAPPPAKPAPRVKPGFPVTLGKHTLSGGDITVHHSAMDKRLRVSYYLSGMGGKQQQAYPVKVRQQRDQVLIDSGSATKSLVPLAEWQAVADTLPVRVSSISTNTVPHTPLLEKMARDVIAYRRQAPSDADWAVEQAAAQGAPEAAAILAETPVAPPEPVKEAAPPADPAEEPTTLSDHQLLKAIQRLEDLHMEATGKRKPLQVWLKREIWRYSMRLPENHPRRKLWQNYKPQPAQEAAPSQPNRPPAPRQPEAEALIARVADQLRIRPTPPNPRPDAIEQGARAAALKETPAAPPEPPPDASPVLCWYHLPLKDPELRHLGNRAKQFERETGRKPERIEVPAALWARLGHPRNWQGISVYELREGEYARSNRHGAAFSAGPTSAKGQYVRPAAPAASPARVAGL